MSLQSLSSEENQDGKRLRRDEIHCSSNEDLISIDPKFKKKFAKKKYKKTETNLSQSKLKDKLRQAKGHTPSD